MSLDKWISVIHAVITGSMFLPWSNSVSFGYANIVTKINLQFGFVRPAAWLMVVFCFFYYFIDFVMKKIEPSLTEKIRLYLIWAFVFVAGFDGFSIVFLTGPGLYVPQIGLIIAFISSVIGVILYNIKIYKSES